MRIPISPKERYASDFFVGAPPQTPAALIQGIMFMMTEQNIFNPKTFDNAASVLVWFVV
jgi:hypothetical protein